LAPGGGAGDQNSWRPPGGTAGVGGTQQLVRGVDRMAGHGARAACGRRCARGGGGHRSRGRLAGVLVLRLAHDEHAFDDAGAGARVVRRPFDDDGAGQPHQHLRLPVQRRPCDDGVSTGGPVARRTASRKTG